MRSKRKWAKDPNNTAWSRNNDTFGHKIMRAQGWAPGQYLGATDAPQSEFYSAANASHIRAVLKDDNMGLGARRNGGDECTGLNDLQELLGRLNGKSTEALDQARKKREDHRVNMYLHRKLGTVRFVHGGFLVGDKVQELADGLKKEKEEAAAAAAREAETTDAKEGKKEKQSKKRRAEEANGLVPETKKEKKSKKRKAEAVEDESKTKSKNKKDKKRKEHDDSTSEAAAAEPEARKDTESSTEVEDTSSRKRSKKDKKDKRKKSKDDEEADPKDASDSQSKKKKKRKSDKDEDGTESSKFSALPTQSSTPSISGTSTPVSEVPHRHLARKRFIAQKRAAVMDQAALNQVGRVPVGV